MFSNSNMSFFDEVLSDPKGLEEKLLGPSYNYTDNINTPSEMGMSSKGNLSTLSKDDQERAKAIAQYRKDKKMKPKLKPTGATYGRGKKSLSQIKK